MLIVGAGGFAKQIFEEIGETEIVFYDDVNLEKHQLWNQFDVLHTLQQVENYFNDKDSRFVLGVGNPILRAKLQKRFIEIGGIICSIVSPNAHVSKYVSSIGEGTIILKNVIVEADVAIGKGCLININVSITHDCKIGDFCEISPGATLLGACNVGDYCLIGAGAIILPKVVIGENAIIGAGACVTKDVPANVVVAGIPAKSI